MPVRLAEPPLPSPFVLEDAGRVAMLSPVAHDRWLADFVPRFIPDPSMSETEWWAEVGVPAGLEPYVVDESSCGACLNAFVRFCHAFPFDPVLTPDEELDLALCALLRKFGPLEAIAGVVPNTPWHSAESPRTVLLAAYHMQVQKLVLAHEDVLSRVGDRAGLAEEIREASEDALQDVFVVPHFKAGRVELRVHARSLRASLWQHILLNWGRTLSRLCELCDQPFEIEHRRGPPNRFCPEHRNPRDRKRAQRLRPVPSRKSQED